MPQTLNALYNPQCSYLVDTKHVKKVLECKTYYQRYAHFCGKRKLDYIFYFLQRNFTHYKKVHKLLETFDINKDNFETGRIIFRFDKSNFIFKKQKVYLSKKNSTRKNKIVYL